MFLEKIIILKKMSGSGKGLLGLWLYRSGEHEWAVKEGSPLHKIAEVRNIHGCARKENHRWISFV